MAKDIAKREDNNSAYLLYNLVVRDFKLKYRRSVLGVVWSVLNPLLSMVVMVLVFTNIFRFDIENYPVYLILGQVMMSLITDATSTALPSIVDNAPLISKIYVNKVVFPTQKVFFSLVNFALSLIAVAAVMIFFRIAPTPKLVLLIPLLVIVLVYSLGLGYLLSTLTVFFRDTIHLWNVFTTLWFYLTPVFWPLQALEANGVGFMADVIQWNPAYHYVAVFRDIMMYDTWPALSELGLCVLFAAVSLCIGLAVFKKFEKKFILYI